MRDTFYKLSIVLARRKTMKQRTRFIAYLTTAFEALGYKCTKLTMRQGKMVKQHLFAGNPENADNILVSAYTTQNKQIMFNRFYPFENEINRKYELINLAVDILFSLLALCVVFFIFYFYPQISSGWLRGAAVVSGGLLAAFAYSASIGRAAFVNYSQSGALSLLVEIAGEKRRTSSFVLCDDTIGSPNYMKRFEYKSISLNNKKILMIDAFSAGDTIYIAYSKNALEDAQKLYEAFNEDKCNVLLVQYDYGEIAALKEAKCIYLAAGNIDANKRFYIPGWKSNKNKMVDIELLKTAQNAIKRIL